jgi:hypothetical protein
MGKRARPWRNAAHAEVSSSAIAIEPPVARLRRPDKNDLSSLERTAQSAKLPTCDGGVWPGRPAARTRRAEREKPLKARDILFAD